MEMNSVFLSKEALKSNTVARFPADKGQNEHKYTFYKTLKGIYGKQYSAQTAQN